MFRRLLVPLDRSPESEEALDAAVSIALAAEATLEVVVVREGALATELPYPLPVVDRQVDEEYLRRITKRVSLAGLTNASPAVLDGNPAEAICAEAKRSGTDLIVMTSHFRTGVARVWSGSVSDQVVRDSGLPVLMIRVTHRPPVAVLTPIDYKRILVPLDGSAAAGAVLPSVRALAKCARAEVVLLRVVQPATVAMSLLASPATISQMGLAPSQADFDVAEQTTIRLLSEASDDLDRTAATLRREGLTNVSWSVETAENVAESMIAFANVQDIDLIALTTRGHGVSRLVAGSVADAFLRHCTTAVLLQCPPRALADQPHLTPAVFESQLPGLVA